MNDKEIEQEVQEKELLSPRVTFEDIQSQIASEVYFSAGDGIIGCPSSPTIFTEKEFDQFDMITFCVLIMKNGHRIVGINEGPVSSTNYDAELGRKMARANAIDKIWPLLGYELRTKLSNGF
jgi:hypothetical protein